MISEKIKTARINAKMTKADVAKKMGVAYSTYDGYERGYRTPKIETLQRIADALEVPLTDLLGITQDEMFNKITTTFPNAPAEEKEGTISFSLVKDGIIQSGFKKDPTEGDLLPDEFNEFERFIESLGCYTRLEDDHYRLHKGDKSVFLSVDALKRLVRTSKATITALIQDLIDNPPQQSKKE